MSLLYNLNESTVVEKVTMKWPSDEYVIPAGTPMSRTGIANDKNAIGILANEARIKFHYPLSVAKHIGKEEPKGKQDYTFSIITSGFVNLTEAEASFGAKISEEAKSAMGEINFVNETEPASFGGGGGSGGGIMIFNVTEGEDGECHSDKTFSEIMECIENGVLPICRVEHYDGEMCYPRAFYDVWISFCNLYGDVMVDIYSNGSVICASEGGGAE